MYHPKIDLVFFLLLEISDSVVAQRYIIHRVSQIVVVKPYSQIYTEKRSLTWLYNGCALNLV